MEKERVIVYVDGFNLYFGLLDAKLHKHKWLDLRKLVLSILKPYQELVEIKYFTSRVSNNLEKQKRQTTYIEALETVGVKMFYGHYQPSKVKCKSCDYIWQTYNEKMTDVNIATQMLIDACQDKYDTAMLISGDSDLVPPIQAIQNNFENKRVFVAFPPNRVTDSVKKAAQSYLSIGRNNIAESQFPNEVKKNNGFVLKKPSTW